MKTPRQLMIEVVDLVRSKSYTPTGSKILSIYIPDTLILAGNDTARALRASGQAFFRAFELQCPP